MTRKVIISLSILLGLIILGGMYTQGGGLCDGPENNLNPAPPPQPMGLPISVEDTMFLKLSENFDASFQKKLEAVISKNEKWSRLISEKKMAIGLVDLSSPRDVKFARINGNHMMYAASLPKIGVLLAMEDALEKGEIIENDEIKSDLRLMMSRSNNQATTRLMDMLGFEKIASVLQDPHYNLYDEDLGGGIWVGKRYAKTGSRVPDPLKGISHAATATQVCRFYYMLAYGKLINFQRSGEMLKYMSDPELHHKFVNTLDHLAPTAKVYRKSGSWKQYHSDSVLVWGPGWRKYILVALVEDMDGENLLRELIAEIDNMLKPKSS